MTNNRVFSSRGKIFALLTLATLICVFLAAAVRTTVIPLPAKMEEPSRDLFFSYVELAKPAYTPTPIIEISRSTTASYVEPSNAAVELTATVESMVQVEIVPDTPLSDAYTAPTVGDASTNEQVSTYSGNKRVLVDISEQHMYVYEGDVLAFSFIASTGINNGTRVGSFTVLDKIPNAYGATWDLWMPNWLGIYWSGTLENGIHALPILSSGSQLWAGYLGTPISFGCVVLGVEESQMLYDWADIGTPVDIQW